MRAVCIDNFSAFDGRVTKRTTYEEVRAAVLRAGRFSVFEATDSDRAAMLYERLHRDPTIVVKDDYGYPWVGPVLPADAGEGKSE